MFRRIVAAIDSDAQRATLIMQTAQEVARAFESEETACDLVGSAVAQLQQAVITRSNEAGNRLVIESWDEERGYRAVERE